MTLLSVYVLCVFVLCVILSEENDFLTWLGNGSERIKITISCASVMRGRYIRESQREETGEGICQRREKRTAGATRGKHIPPFGFPFVLPCSDPMGRGGDAEGFGDGQERLTEGAQGAAGGNTQTQGGRGELRWDREATVLI